MSTTLGHRQHTAAYHLQTLHAMLGTDNHDLACNADGRLSNEQQQRLIAVAAKQMHSELLGLRRALIILIAWTAIPYIAYDRDELGASEFTMLVAPVALVLAVMVAIYILRPGGFLEGMRVWIRLRFGVQVHHVCLTKPAFRTDLMHGKVSSMRHYYLKITQPRPGQRFFGAGRVVLQSVYLQGHWLILPKFVQIKLSDDVIYRFYYIRLLRDRYLTVSVDYVGMLEKPVFKA